MLAHGMRTLLHRCVFVALLSVVAAGILAGPTDVERLRIKAEQGDADTQLKLGLAYNSGKGVPQHHAEAVKWLRLAAEQGHAAGQHNLGVAYVDGLGVPQNYT